MDGRVAPHGSEGGWAPPALAQLGDRASERLPRRGTSDDSCAQAASHSAAGLSAGPSELLRHGNDDDWAAGAPQGGWARNCGIGWLAQGEGLSGRKPPAAAAAQRGLAGAGQAPLMAALRVSGHGSAGQKSAPQVQLGRGALGRMSWQLG